MCPDQDDLEEEIRGHLAISIKERIERGEDPASARLAALKEFGNVSLTRDSIRSVWRPGWLDAAEALGRDIRFALRSLLRARGLAATVIVTLALGIGANAAIFSVVRGVLLRPLVNRDEDRLMSIRQGASEQRSQPRGPQRGSRVGVETGCPARELCREPRGRRHKMVQ